MRTFILSCALALGSLSTFAQGYQFTDVVKVPATPVKNQASTGTCWCFATTSFMESELLRMGKGTYDLSEMFIVRQKYMNQLQDNYVRQGRGNIGQGSLSHTFMNAFNQVGIVPEEVYSGINYDSDRHNHAEMVKYIKAIATTAVDMKKRSPEYYKLIDNLFDTYLGKLPEKFTYQGKEYTPKTFAASLGLNMDDYIELTSFTHHPYYVKFDVEVPDNWEHSLMYNLPLDEMMQTVDYALNNGFTEAVAGCNENDLIKAAFGIHRKHNTGSTLIGANHSLDTGGKGYISVIKAFVNAVRDRTVVVERSEYFLHSCEHLFETDDVQVSFLLAGKGSVRKVFGSSGRTNSNGNFLLVALEPLIVFSDFFFELGRERSFFNPFTNFSAGLCQLFNIINV